MSQSTTSANILNASASDVDSYNISHTADVSIHKGFRVLQLNARSIYSFCKFNNLLCFINSVKHDFENIILGESWLSYIVIVIYMLFLVLSLHILVVMASLET